jgi:putative OPT family oligopeptide transporter
MSEHENFHPHVPASTEMKEFTFRATLTGMLFGFFFAVANAYLALKIGQTVTASIPAAILAMAISKAFFKQGTILENNLIQTIASVGEGLAGGVIFTIPALILLGESPSIGRIFILSALGGLLGILFMIPMRRYIIVKEHKTLPFPEGTACAEILKSGEKNHKTAIMVVWGLAAAAIFKICSNVLFLWKEQVAWVFDSLKKGTFSIETTPSLLGVGYIIGLRMTAIVFAGGVLAWWGIIPLIVQFGTGSTAIFPSDVPIEGMSADDIWSNYVRYIGAGCLAIGGIFSLIKVAPVLLKTIHCSFTELMAGVHARDHLPRTEKDISLAWLLFGSLASILFLWGFPTLPMNLLTVVLLVVLGFFFVAVTSLTVGLIGTSSNPVSGMTITTLLITCILFVLLGWTERLYLISAMTMGCVACCAICMAGTTAQDLKTGYLLGATPKSQQLAEIIGVIVPSLALGYTLYILNQAYGIGSPDMPAPQATLMSMIVKGVIEGGLPYALVGIGVSIGVVLIILKIPVLAFALGLYLPLSLSTAILVGGLARAYVDRKTQDPKQSQEQGTLLAAGLIGGDACIGIGIALATLTGLIPKDKAPLLPDWVSLAAYLFLGAGLAICALRKKER